MFWWNEKDETDLPVSSNSGAQDRSDSETGSAPPPETESPTSDIVKGAGRSFFLATLASDVFFLVASGLKTYFAFGIYQNSLSSNDDETTTTDEYVFKTLFKKDDAFLYMMVYLGAAFFYMIVGLIDGMNHGGMVGATMFFAGGFGVASVMAERHEKLAVAFIIVSAHLFFSQAVIVLCKRQFFGGIKPIFKVADLFFGVGALIDCALSWFYLTDFLSDNIYVNYAFLGSSGCWGIAALLYMFTTLHIH